MLKEVTASYTNADTKAKVFAACASSEASESPLGLAPVHHDFHQCFALLKSAMRKLEHVQTFCHRTQRTLKRVDFCAKKIADDRLLAVQYAKEQETALARVQTLKGLMPERRLHDIAESLHKIEEEMHAFDEMLFCMDEAIMMEKVSVFNAALQKNSEDLLSLQKTLHYLGREGMGFLSIIEEPVQKITIPSVRFSAPAILKTDSSASSEHLKRRPS